MVIKVPHEARKKSKTGIYHIIWRGANRQEIFHDRMDWIQFLDTFKRYKIKNQLSIYAWCLMGNHVHMLIKEGNEHDFHYNETNRNQLCQVLQLEVHHNRLSISGSV